MSLPRRIPPELPGGEVLVRKPMAIGQVWRAVPSERYPEGMLMRVQMVLSAEESGCYIHGEAVIEGGGTVPLRADGTPLYEGWALVEELPG